MSKAKLSIWVLGSVILPFLALPLAEAQGGHGERLQTHTRQPCTVRDPLMSPTHQIWHAQDVVWQIPRDPKAILFLAHGKGQDPFAFFDPGHRCPRCYGLPESRRVVLGALRRRYAVVAMKSIEIGWTSWPIETSEDLSNVVGFINFWRREHGLQRLPLVAWGHSAGGFLVTSLTRRMAVSAVVLMCSQGQREVEESAVPGQFPPAFFAYMNYNGTMGVTTVADVENAMAVLAARNVPVAWKRLAAQQIGSVHFTNRIRCMTEEMTKRVSRACEAEGWVDGDGYLKDKAATVDWRAVFRKWGALPYCEQQNDLCLIADVEQELKMALGAHGISSQADDEIFSWLESVVPSSRVPSDLAPSLLDGSSCRIRIGKLHRWCSPPKLEEMSTSYRARRAAMRGGE